MMESWFGSLWRTSRKSLSSEADKPVIGILAFEVASLMSKVVHLWQCLSDRLMFQLREELINSLGIQKLVSDDVDYLMDLALAEIIENFGCVAKSVARLGKKCTDPIYHHLERIFDDPVEIIANWCGWEYKFKKMEKKVKKLGRFAAVTSQLYQELEVLAELEHNLRRMHASVDLGKVKLLEFQQKVMWQRQEVKNLREMSPWIRTYDYTVRLLLRSLFTIVERIKQVFGINQLEAFEGNEFGLVSNDRLVRSRSISAITQSSVFPSENTCRYSGAGPLGRSVSNLGLSDVKYRSNNKKPKARYHPEAKTRRLTHVGPFKGCMMSGSDSPVLQSCMPTSKGSLRSSVVLQKGIDKTRDTNMPLSCCNTVHAKISLFTSKHKLLNSIPSTLGDAALALHYANVIILIEKLALSPHLIGLDARDDLYNMLPASVRASLREKLKLFNKKLASSIYDAAIAAEWNSILARILEWLAPLAHNMIRWHSERNFEKQRVDSGTNVLLIQTLHFANQAKTEAAITEVLLGLNYISRFAREINNRAFMDSSCNRDCDDYLLHED